MLIYINGYLFYTIFISTQFRQMAHLQTKLTTRRENFHYNIIMCYVIT